MLHYIRTVNERSASLLLLLLLSADIVFLVLYIAARILDSGAALCNSTTGICGYMNAYHLIKLFWIIVLFLSVLRLTRCSGYVSWTLMFTCFFIDDALWLHQKIGERIAAVSNDYFFQGAGLQSRYYELAVLTMMGLVLLFLVAWSYIHGTQMFRKVSIELLLFLAALAFFGLIVDAAKAAGLGRSAIFGLRFVEDGGELVVYSLIVWYVFLLAMRNGKMDLFLHELI